MHMACWYGHLSVCQWLHAAGAASDISKADKRGATSMIVACLYDHLRGCKWLVEVGAIADITKADNFGFTPMHVACWCKVMPVYIPNP